MLTREQVVSVYRQVLSRTPSEAEIEHHTATAGRWTRCCGSRSTPTSSAGLSERGVSTARSRAVVNVFHPDLAAWECRRDPFRRRDRDRRPRRLAVPLRRHQCQPRPVRRRGADGARLAGGVGGGDPAARGGSPRARRRRGATRRARQARGLRGALPEPLERVGPRPVERLLSVPGLPIVYPLRELRAATASEEVYLRTDTHLTFRGNEPLLRGARRTRNRERAELR